MCKTNTRRRNGDTETAAIDDRTQLRLVYDSDFNLDTVEQDCPKNERGHIYLNVEGKEICLYCDQEFVA